MPTSSRWNSPRTRRGTKATQRRICREVFVNKNSATRSEFYTAKQAGDKIVLVLEVKAADYQGEERVEFDRKPYEVVRAYTPPNGEKVELNLKEAPVAAKAAQEPPGEEGKG